MQLMSPDKISIGILRNINFLKENVVDVVDVGSNLEINLEIFLDKFQISRLEMKGNEKEMKENEKKMKGNEKKMKENERK